MRRRFFVTLFLRATLFLFAFFFLGARRGLSSFPPASRPGIGIILGLAYIQRRYQRAGEKIGILSLPRKPLVEKPNKADLTPGDKIQLPDAATVLLRFPDDEERSHWLGEEVQHVPHFLPAGE